MAVIKANFTRSRRKIKATLRYITHRPGRGGERLTRTLFGHDGELSKEEAYQLIDAHKGMTYFRVVLNFDAKREDVRKDLNLRDITRQTIRALEERLQRTIGFIAVEHNDHTALRHIHAICIVKLARGERIGREDWKALRQITTAQALLQRRALDIVRHYHKNLHHDLSAGRHERIFSKRSISHFSGVVGGRAQYRRIRRVRRFKPTLSCANCGYKNQMVKLMDGKYWCPVCGKVRERAQGLSL